MLALGLRVKINSTLTVWNEGETAEMYALADSLGLPLRFDLQVSPRDDGDRTPLNVAPTRRRHPRPDARRERTGTRSSAGTGSDSH